MPKPLLHPHTQGFLRECRDLGLTPLATIDDLCDAIVQVQLSATNFGLRCCLRDPDQRDATIFRDLLPRLAVRQRSWDCESRDPAVQSVSDVLRTHSGKRFFASQGELDAAIEAFRSDHPDSVIWHTIKEGRSELRRDLADELVDADAAAIVSRPLTRRGGR